MIKFYKLHWCCILIILLQPLRSTENYSIEHLEPPFWWTGMADNKLQLMVHGKNISDLEPEFFYPGIEINQVNRLSNPKMINNQDVYLKISMIQYIFSSFKINHYL